MIEVFMLKIKELYWNRVIKTRDISFTFFNISQGGDNGGLSEYSEGSVGRKVRIRGHTCVK